LISYPFPELALLEQHCEVAIRTALTQHSAPTQQVEQALLTSVIASKTKLFCDTLRSRVIEHNIRVVARYYTKIRLSRLAQLLALTPQEVEERLSMMVALEDIAVRIDRPAGLVMFSAGSGGGTETGEMNDILTNWSSDISKMLNLVETTCHLIHRETMVHKANSLRTSASSSSQPSST
jgi:26S proteasome regulatory subunit N5